MNFDFHEHTDASRMTPERILIKKPPLGNKVWLLDRRGIFILEDGPTQILTFACTNAGSGALKVIDGVPDANGFFPEPPKPVEPDFIEIVDEDRNGKCIYHANPAILQMWFFQAGLNHGLTIISAGEHISSAPMATITWERYIPRK